jgi:hypothetical protein
VIVGRMISTNMAVKNVFDSLLYNDTVKYFGVTGWMFYDKNV